MNGENRQLEALQRATAGTGEHEAFHEWISGITMTISKAASAKDLSAVLDRIADKVGQLLRTARPGTQILQRMTALLTHLWLVMTDIERIELEKRGKKQEIVDSFDDLERRIRCIRDDIDRL